MKKYLSIIKIIFISLILTIGLHYVFAVSRPVNAPTNDIQVINNGTSDQGIGGPFKIGGAWLSSNDPNYSTEQEYQLVVNGSIFSNGLRLSKVAPPLGLGSPYGGNLYVQGSIKANNITGSGNYLCVDAGGNFKKCN